MPRRLIAAIMSAGMLACTGAVAPLAASPVTSHSLVGDESYPFEGRWDCEVAIFTFTPRVYDNGSEVLPIQEIQEGTDGSYTLFFEGDYLITLSGFTGSEMGWYSHESGDGFGCRRID